MSSRLDVRRMLLHRGWTEPDGIGRTCRKGAAVWAPTNNSGDSALSVQRGRHTVFTIAFPREVPARVIVATCEASTGV